MIAVMLAIVSATANAQGLSPMREEFATYTDQFAVRLKAQNPYATPQRFSVAVYEQDWRASTARALTPFISLPPHETASFLVIGDNPQDEPRTIFVCLTSQPFVSGRGPAVRGEVCGNYRILRRRP